MSAAVTLKGLRRQFSDSSAPAVDDISLEVRAGEVLCLVGPSGCGKSTTLRLVAGLESPDAGSIRIGERDVSRVPPQERDVAMVFQGFALYPHMKVRDILAFPLKMRRVSRADREHAVGEAAELLGISALLDRKPAQLSGGEQQRVAMGRAIVRKPKVFLFDEPLSNLDAALRAELRVELGRLLRRLEVTALYVTHDQSEAMTLGQRIAVLRKGKLEQLGPPREIYERPVSAFVAGFFGSPPMNLVETTLDQGVPSLAGHHWELPHSVTRAPLLGVRPEHISLEAPGQAQLEARVVSIEPHGADTHVELELAGQSVRTRAPGFDAPEPGSSVGVRVDASKIRWFDAASGKAL